MQELVSTGSDEDQSCHDVIDMDFDGESTIKCPSMM